MIEDYLCFDTNLSDKIRRGIMITESYDSLSTLKEQRPRGIVGEYYRVGNDVYSWITDIENYSDL